MKHKLLSPAVLALLLASPFAGAQTAPATPATPSAVAAPSANAVDPKSIQALKDMGAHLQSLNRFTVSTTLTGERVLTDGQKLMHTAYATVDAERPNKLRALLRSARSTRDFVYDGKTFTIFIPAQKYYSSVAFSEPISGLVGKLEDRFGVEIPLSDLFTWGTPAAPVDKIDSAMNVGQAWIGKDLCDHYAFRQGSADWQIWITANGKPLPRKLVITNRADEARPQSVSLMEWSLKPAFTASTFKFTPPNGATRIEMVPLKAK